MSKEIRNSIFNLSEGTGIGIQTWTQLLPQKLIVTPDVYTEEMDATTGWAVNRGTLELNNAEVYSGTGSLKVTTPSGLSVWLEKSVNLDLSADSGNTLRLYVYPHTDITTTFNYVLIAVSTGDATFTNYFSATFDYNNVVNNSAWNTIMLFAGWGIGAGNPNWNSVKRIRIIILPKTSQVLQVSLDLLHAGRVTKPVVLLTFDDGAKSVYTNAYPLIKAKKMSATAYVVSDFTESGFGMSASQLIEMNSHHIDIGNHTSTHTIPFTGLTQQQMEDDVEACRVLLDGLGLTRASKHVALNTVSNATTKAAMIHWGATTQRGSQNYRGSNYDMEWPLDFPARAMNNNDSLATVKGFFTIPLALGNANVLIFHEIVDSNADTATKWLTSQFSDLLDWIEAQGYQTLTVDEYYRLNSGPITVHHK